MENQVIETMRQTLELAKRENWNPAQIKWFEKIVSDAVPVRCVRAADVFTDAEIEYIKHVIKPKVKQCYRNAHLLCESFPDRVKYVEGRVAVQIDVEHAFNIVDGEFYVDITFEFALKDDPTQYDYIKLGCYDVMQIHKFAYETGYYGDYYRYEYMQKSPDE